MLLILKVLKNLVKIFFVLLFIGCSNDPKIFLYSKSGNALGTYYKIIYTDTKPLENLTQLTDSIFSEINQSMSTYISNSDISKINKEINSVEIDNHFKKVFNESKIIWKSTNGFFDPTIGLLSKAYGFGPENELKKNVNIDSLMNFVGFEKVAIENNFVRKKVKGIYLDFNAIAKGYCVDVISNMLKEKNINNHLVEIGGEMVASGKNQITNTFWRVGITDPLNVSSNNFISKIELKNKSLASSGNYRKYIVDKKSGKKIVHTINPKNGNAYKTNILGTSVIANHCMTADAYATSFMAMPIKKSKELISSLKNIDVMIIYYDENSQMKIYKTEGFDKLILD